MIAAIGAGRFADYADLADYIKSGMIFEPNEANHRLYTQYLSIYERLYEATGPLMHELVGMGGDTEG